MKIRTNATHAEMHRAARDAGVTLARFEVRGSRTHDFGYDVILQGSSNRRANGGYGGAMPAGYAATWDEWGYFLAGVFAVDPTTWTTYYADREDFDWRTGGRYASHGFGLAYGHKPCTNHQWQHNGTFEGVTEHYCAKDCGAVRRLGRVG